MRSRCVLKDFKTTMRDDISSINKLLLHAAWNDLRVETGDFVLCARSCKQTRQVRCALDLRKVKKNEGWIWRLHGAMDGKRTTCRDLTEFLAGVPTECKVFLRGKLERSIFVHGSNETRVVSDVDDPLTCAKPATFIAHLWCAWDLNTCSNQESGRRGFTVRPTAKYVDECLNLVQLQNTIQNML